MPNEVLLYGQIASILLFLGALFTIYRSLASQKDATIQVLKEQIELLKLQLEQAHSQAPDVAVEALSKRVKSLTEELSRLQHDASASADVVAGKERELERAQEEMDQLRDQVARAEKFFTGFSCPTCKAPMETREYHSEMVEYNGRDIDIDHEFVTYECGLELSDGNVTRPCGSR